MKSFSIIDLWMNFIKSSDQVSFAFVHSWINFYTNSCLEGIKWSLNKGLKIYFSRFRFSFQFPVFKKYGFIDSNFDAKPCWAALIKLLQFIQQLFSKTARLLHFWINLHFYWKQWTSIDFFNHLYFKKLWKASKYA